MRFFHGVRQNIQEMRKPSELYFKLPNKLRVLIDGSSFVVELLLELQIKDVHVTINSLIVFL